MKAKIYINRHKVNKIKKGAPEEPVIAIRTYKGVEYTTELKGFVKLKQDFSNPLCSGATVWAESAREGITTKEEESGNAKLLINIEMTQKGYTAKRLKEIANEIVERILEKPFGFSYHYAPDENNIKATAKYKQNIIDDTPIMNIKPFYIEEE